MFTQTQVQVFVHPDFGGFKAIQLDGKPWVATNEIVSVLGYLDAAPIVSRRVSEEDRINLDRKTQRSLGIDLEQHGGWFINEAGLHQFFQSRSEQKPRAKQFEDWLTEAVFRPGRKEANSLQTFTHDEFGKVRMVRRKEEPYAIGLDIARALNYASPAKAIADYCKEEATYWKILDNKNQWQTVRILSVGDIYRLILHVPGKNKDLQIKTKTERFKQWLYNDVMEKFLSSFHVYNGITVQAGTPSMQDSPNAASSVRLVQELTKERKERKKLERKIERDREKVVLAEAISGSKNTILVGELAKILRGNGIEMGEKRLFARLRESGYLIKRKGIDYNMPTQKAMEKGLFVIKEMITRFDADGEPIVRKTPRVTGKGQVYFVNYFLNK